MRFAHRKAYASVLAMLMLVLGTTMSAWLYTMVQNGIAIGRNDQVGTRTQMVSESGLAYMQLKLRAAYKRSPIELIDDDAAMLVSVGNALASELPAGRVTVVQTVPPEVLVASTDVRGGTFTAALTLSRVYAHGFNLSVTGSSGSVSSTIGIEYMFADDGLAAWMNYPMLSRGTMQLGSNSGSAVEVHHWNKKTQLADSDLIGESHVVDGGYVMEFGDTTPPTDIEFPPKYLADEVYAKLESMKGSTLADFRPVKDKHGRSTPTGSLSNRYIPPNTSVTFADGAVLTGIIYVGYPSNLTFDLGVTINGVIIFERPTEGEAGSVSAITLNKTISLQSNPVITAAELGSVLVSSGESAASAAAYAKLIDPWMIHAPDTDLNMVEGNTNTLDYWGSMHVRDFLKSGGGGAGDENLYRIHGTIVCEGIVDLRGNRRFSMDPESENRGDDAVETLALVVRPGGYWER